MRPFFFFVTALKRNTGGTHTLCLGRGEHEMMSQLKASRPYVMSDQLITLNRDAAHLGAFSSASPQFWRL